MGSLLGQVPPLHKVARESVEQFLRNPAIKQTKADETEPPGWSFYILFTAAVM